MKSKEKVLKFKKPGVLEVTSLLCNILPPVRQYKALYYILKYAKYASK